MIYTCQSCGKTFNRPGKRIPKFCSMACKGVASRLPMKSCEVCGKTYKPRMGCGDRPCCSRACGYVYRRTGKTVSCAWCQEPFYLTASRLKLDARFCSKPCANEWQSRDKTDHTCSICGKAFRWSPSRHKAYNIKYCSQVCRDADPARQALLVAMNAKQQDGRETSIERIGYQILDELGIPYFRQFVIGGKFTVDAFVFGGTVVQFDGDYWHGNPAKFPEPDARQSRRIRLDHSQDRYMVKCGYRVVRLWETDLRRDAEEVKERLRQLLTPERHTPVARESDRPAP